jgi:Fe-S oxidoreductase
MDILLLMVLSGVALAWFKRLRSKALGLKRTTKHTLGDRIALSALWLIFPLRLIAESASSGLKGMDTFLTGSIGNMLVNLLGESNLYVVSSISWWAYSIALGVFMFSLPFSRYMHIFTEIPLIFLRKYKVHSGETAKSFDHFQIEACSRCGICIDPCQLQSDAGIGGVQSVYFLRDRRYRHLSREVADNCLMCGRCEVKCPVGIELNTLRLNSRQKFTAAPASNRYDYLRESDHSEGSGKVGYFAGCMTLLTPKILRAMDSIFAAAKEDVWYADRDGGVCCGRPLKLSGEIDAARKMMDFNKELFRKHGITTLVTSCPICLKVFREDYALEGIEVLHHSQYILRLLRQSRITVAQSDMLYTYHDPCELGRGSGIYDEPRDVISRIGNFVEPEQNRENAMCCGSSIANIAINDKGQSAIGAAVAAELSETGATSIVTACPLCKKAVGRNSPLPVVDLAEAVSASLR